LWDDDGGSGGGSGACRCFHISLSGSLLNCCRYVHIGPKLCSLLVRLEETDEVDGVNSESCQCVCLQDLWHHLALPPDVTLMLCSNGIQHQRIQAFPANILFVQYGFQVCVCVCMCVILVLHYITD